MDLGGKRVAVDVDGKVTLAVLDRLAGIVAAFLAAGFDCRHAPTVDDGRARVRQGPLGIGQIAFVTLRLAAILFPGRLVPRHHVPHGVVVHPRRYTMRDHPNLLQNSRPRVR